MEEKISAAESRGAASGFFFQNFLNALQQKTPKTNIESTNEYPSCSGLPGKNVDELESTDTWKESLSLTRQKLNKTWEQYTPTLKDRVRRYSPNPLKKLKVLFTVSEEKDLDYDASGMDCNKGTDEVYINEELNDVGSSPDNDKGNEDVGEDLKIESSHIQKVPSVVSSSLDCDHCLPETLKQDGVKLDHQPPYIILQEADSNGNGEKDTDVNSDHLHRSKSPLTVQEWVDHLPIKNKTTEKDCANSLGSKDLDNHDVTEPPQEERKSLIAHRLSREASVQSSSSLDSLLDSRRPDPVEVLLNLGFGGVPGVDMNNCRIPKRFLVPSKCKGGDWNEFLKRELLQAQNFECASLGFRGLSGPSYRRPSAIVANIMEKLRERTSPHHPVKNKFSSVARRVLNEKSVLNKMVSPSMSVLSLDSRKFLENQGKKSPEVPRRRIIFGQKSFAIGNDGEFIEVEPPLSQAKVKEKESTTSMGSSSTDSDFDERKMSPVTLPSPEEMLKLRRSSLQRQKKVEEEPETSLSDTGENHLSAENKHSKSDKKIPMRFVTPVGSLDQNEVEEIKIAVEEEIKALSQKIQNASSVELTSILLQMKELRTRFENS